MPPPPAPAAGEELERLVDELLEKTEIPIDRYAVAATLESWGVRDVDARERHGHADVFSLADEVFTRSRARLAAAPPPRKLPEREPLRKRARLVLGWLARGSFFLIPMTIQLVFLFGLGFGLWLSLDFTTAEFTVIACASIASFVLSDGFIAAIGRLGSIYGDQGKHLLAQRALRRVLAGGAVVSLAAVALWLPASEVFGLFPLRKAALGGAYFVLLMWLWLALAILYVTKRRVAIVLTSTGGLGVIYLLTDVVGTNRHLAHLAAIGFVAAAALAWGTWVLARRAAATAEELRAARMPRRGLILWALAPYFAYGVLYYALLFFDRLVAWTAAAGKPEGYAVWFRTPYELGLDWALASFLPAIALLEYAINRFSHELVPAHERASGFDLPGLNRSLLRLYLRHAGMLAAALVIGTLGMWYFGLWLRDAYPDVSEIRDFFESPVTYDVHHLAVAGYGLLALGLLNGVYIGSFQRPWLVVRAFVAALAVGGTVSIVLAVAVEYWWAAAGITAGATVFATLTTVTAVRLLRCGDYNYFAAY